MLNKIVVRNVGVLKAFDTPNAPKLASLSLFYGRNGRGKSTLTAVLRAARNGCSTTVMARQSLGNGGAAPEVILIGDAATTRFASGKWSPAPAPIEVFDTAFITDNVCAGELIDLAHDRGLFSLIIGEEGVKLSIHLDRFNALAKDAATALKAADQALSDDIPADMERDEFFALGANDGYDARLETAERTLKAVQQADKIAVLPSLGPLATASLPGGFATTLAKTVAEIDGDARGRLVKHFHRFGLDKRAEEWVSYGVDHVHDDACPFCGRDEVDAKGMLTLYGQIFGETYKGHMAVITETAVQVEEALGEAARAALMSQVAANAATLKRWEEFVHFESDLPEVATISDLLMDAHCRTKALLTRKRSAPLDRVEDASELERIGASLDKTADLIGAYNEAVSLANTAATKAKTDAAPMTLEQATRARDNVKKRIARLDAGVQKRITAYLRAKRRDARARKMRTNVQKRLKEANEQAAQHYHERVNHYLRRFGANFSITKIKNSMQGNAGQADYGLVIKGEVVDRQRGRVADGVPSFRTTLSAGDKTTLALAFFLAKLDHDDRLCEKTIVVDDPLSSHDSHRRRMTIEAIRELCGRCGQVIVLSHDEFLLRELERRCSGTPCAAFQIDYNGGDEWSVASAADLDQLCRAGHAKMVDEIASFVDDRQGDPDVIVLKIRQVLETHYRRSYSAYFDHDQNLGKIVRSIKEAGPSHPCFRDVERVDMCNDATCDKHHGDDAIVVVRRGVDPDELRVIATDALELIGARRPTTPADTSTLVATILG